MREGLSISNMKDKIEEALMDLEVIVEVRKTDNESYTVKGQIDEIEPFWKVHLELDEISGTELPFVGIDCGIYKITDAKTNKILYLNTAIENTYNNENGGVLNLFSMRVMAVGDACSEYANRRPRVGNLSAILVDVIKLREKGRFFID